MAVGPNPHRTWGRTERPLDTLQTLLSPPTSEFSLVPFCAARWGPTLWEILGADYWRDLCEKRDFTRLFGFFAARDALPARPARRGRGSAHAARARADVARGVRRRGSLARSEAAAHGARDARSAPSLRQSGAMSVAVGGGWHATSWPEPPAGQGGGRRARGAALRASWARGARS